MIELRPVNPDRDTWFLYELLRTRLTEPQYNISHKRLPAYADHVNFVDSQPYKVWDVITYVTYDSARRVSIGASYISKQDEIGIYLLPYCRKQGFGSEVVEAYQSQAPRLLANVAKANKPSQAFFEKHGFKLRETQPEQLVYLWERANDKAQHPVDGGTIVASPSATATG